MEKAIFYGPFLPQLFLLLSSSSVSSSKRFILFWPIPIFFHVQSFHDVCFCISFLTSDVLFFVFFLEKKHNHILGSHFLFWHVTYFFLLSLSSHLPCFLFREARLISSGMMSENVPLFRHLGDNYEICWTSERPHSQHCSKSNLIPRRV